RERGVVHDRGGRRGIRGLEARVLGTWRPPWCTATRALSRGGAPHLDHRPAPHAHAVGARARDRESRLGELPGLLRLDLLPGHRAVRPPAVAPDVRFLSALARPPFPGLPHL